jgi:hypothetical protein
MRAGSLHDLHKVTGIPKSTLTRILFTLKGQGQGQAKAELARAAGARHVINYRTRDVAAEICKVAPDVVGIIVEVAPAANAALDQSRSSRLAPPGPSTPPTAAASSPCRCRT